jgi:O-antigen/teichoic acid export membrane protein
VTLFNLIGNILLIPYLSFIWSWIITLLSQIMLTIFWYFYTRHLISFKIPILFIVKNILFWASIYIFWNFLLSHFSRGIYFDFIVYGGLFLVLYAGFFLFIFKEIRSHVQKAS